MKLVFLGKPGAGKGTQADRMSEERDLLHASTGDMFREAVNEGTEVGKQAKEYMDQGLLVPDKVTCRVVEEMVVDRHDDYVLDGFPRTVPQADALEEMREKARGLDEEFAQTEMAEKVPFKLVEDLQLMQDAWKAWREKRCAFEAMLHRGTPEASMSAAWCMVRTTGRQALFLERSAQRD